MSFLVGGIRGRVFTAFWLLLYAAAGLLAHSSLGHNHWHGPAATEASVAGHQHSHAGHAHDCPFHRHGHSPSHGHHENHVAGDQEHQDHNHSQHDHSDHEDCAGCKLLGSISAPAVAVVLEESGRLILAAPVLEVSLWPAVATGVHLARAPPVA